MKYLSENTNALFLILFMKKWKICFVLEKHILRMNNSYIFFIRICFLFVSWSRNVAMPRLLGDGRLLGEGLANKEAMKQLQGGAAKIY